MRTAFTFASNTGARASFVLVAWLAFALVSCGPNTANRDKDADLAATSRGGAPIEVALSTDATWLSAAVGPNVVYAVGQPNDPTMMSVGDRILVAFEAATGEELWRSEFSLPGSLANSYYADLSVLDSIILLRLDYGIMGLSKADGTVNWTIDSQMSPIRYVGAQSAAIITSDLSNTITSYSISDGSKVEEYTISGYLSIQEAWLTNDGKQIVATAEPSSSMGEIAVVVLDLEAGGAPREVFRNPIRYDVEMMTLGPTRYIGASMPSYSQSDFVGQTLKNYDKVELKAWSTLSGEQVWDKEIRIDPNDYTTYYAQRLYLAGRYALVQEPSSEGVLLKNVLRLNFHDLSAQRRQWTTIVPTRSYVDSLSYVDAETVIVHTRNDNEPADRWYAFATLTGDLLWVSREEGYYGSIRAMDSNGKLMVRLMTTNWVDGKLLIDHISK
ncbi:MAG: hypothetical protein AUK47_10610 [Deltaproteobacteria bacterium CG2_30_63_29]|nr:MAG: hypothetical protein AUK47_10610 [Deltaproteobacteria bacterium CG2_30_63_29]